ncbi:MAG: hypothetical protein JST84_05405 [Acidobacteria bacterium]|nr:hypothetical protein [Acidobacteriota bacterium]
MANNYTKFSFRVAANAAEQEWLRQTYDRIEAVTFHETEPANEWEKSLLDHGSAGFELFYDEDSITITSAEDGDVQVVCQVLQRFLRHFHSPARIGFDWAETCSQLRPGEFGGGAAVISATNITIQSTAELLQKMLNENSPTGTEIAD